MSAPKTKIVGQNGRHGMYGTPTYASWASMHARCKGTASNPKHYVEKGVKVCESWRNFRNFLADMGERPDGMTLDRFPNRDGNYEPGNCRWASKKQQSRNRSSARILVVNGETASIAEWSERTGVNEATIRGRLKRGWTAEQAIRQGDFHCQSGRWAHGPNPQVANHG